MSNVFITPYMGLPLPIPGQDPGPDYANNQYSSGIILDQHNHSPGSGQQINPSGIIINADLPINDNNLTLVKTLNFSAQSGPLSGIVPNIGCVYVAGNELYYNDEAGNVVAITNNGSVNAGAGSISGLPSGTASVFFNGSTYVFQQATNTAANLDAASIIIRNTTVNSNGITLSAPNSLPANATETLPLPPSTKGIMTMDPSGNMNVEPAAPAATSFIVANTSGNLSTQPVFFGITAGVGGTYPDPQAAFDAAATDQTVLLLRGTYTGPFTLSKRLYVQGQGFGTVLNGDLLYDTGSSDAIVKGIQVTGNVAFTQGVREVTFTEFYIASSSIITNDEGNFLQGMRL